MITLVSLAEDLQRVYNNLRAMHTETIHILNERAKQLEKWSQVRDNKTADQWLDVEELILLKYRLQPLFPKIGEMIGKLPQLITNAVNAGDPGNLRPEPSMYVMICMHHIDEALAKINHNPGSGRAKLVESIIPWVEILYTEVGICFR